MSQKDKTLYCHKQPDKLDKLEEEILLLEIENHERQQRVKRYDFDQYKLQEIQRLAKIGTWELNHLSYNLAISDELSQLLFDKPTNMVEISWQDFLDTIIAANDINIKQELIENVIQNGKSLDFEHNLKKYNNEIIYVRHHCKTFYNSIGQPLITVGMVHDFTFEHKQSLELKRRSITDELTQLYNRRHINKVLKEQRDIFIRYKTVSSYIMLDVDHFKRINDSFGHQVGDEVLQKFAKLIQNMIRSIDYASRWGGEEFLIICPNTTLANTVLLAEKLRKGLMKLKISTGTVVTASFGVGEISDGECTNTLLKRIDDALYEAKDNGRNRLVKSRTPR